MDCNLDWKNIAGLFPIPQQILGIYEIGKGLYETAVIIVEAVAAAFKELRESHFPKKASNDGWLPLGDVVITDTDRANATGSPVPLFTDKERRDTVPTPEPKPTRNSTSNVFYCDANRPLMTEEMKNRPSIDITSHNFRPVNITKKDKLNAKTYEPFIDLHDEGRLLFTEEERRAAIQNTREPEPTKNFTNNIFYCDSSRPLMTEEEKTTLI